MSMNEDLEGRMTSLTCAGCDRPMDDEDAVPAAGRPNELICMDCATMHDEQMQQEPDTSVWTEGLVTEIYVGLLKVGDKIKHLGEPVEVIGEPEGWANGWFWVPIRRASGEETRVAISGLASVKKLNEGQLNEMSFHPRYGDWDPEDFAEFDEGPEWPEDLKPYKDEAYEWVGVNYPDLDGVEVDKKALEVAAEFAENDEGFAQDDVFHEGTMNETWTSPPADANKKHTCLQCDGVLVPYLAAGKEGGWTCSDCGEIWTNAELEEYAAYAAQGEPCPKCGSTNTEQEEPISSMAGYGEDVATKCNDCGKVWFYGPEMHGEGYSFDRHVDAILIKEARGREVKHPETANRKMDKKYRERPANRTRYNNGGSK